MLRSASEPTPQMPERRPNMTRTPCGPHTDARRKDLSGMRTRDERLEIGARERSGSECSRNRVCRVGSNADRNHVSEVCMTIFARSCRDYVCLYSNHSETQAPSSNDKFCIPHVIRVRMLKTTYVRCYRGWSYRMKYMAISK